MARVGELTSLPPLSVSSPSPDWESMMPDPPVIMPPPTYLLQPSPKQPLLSVPDTPQHPQINPEDAYHQRVKTVHSFFFPKLPTTSSANPLSLHLSCSCPPSSFPRSFLLGGYRKKKKKDQELVKPRAGPALTLTLKLLTNHTVLLV